MNTCTLFFTLLSARAYLVFFQRKYGICFNNMNWKTIPRITGDLQTIFRFSWLKVYKYIILWRKFENIKLSWKEITMFSKFITNYIEQGWWHSRHSLKFMLQQFKKVNKRGRHAYIYCRWTWFSRWYCNGNQLPHKWNLCTCYVIILVQCNFFMIFQIATVNVCC